MKKFGVFLILVTLLASAGCVTTKKYNERLADIEGLKNDKSALEDRIKQLEEEKATLESEKAAAEAEIERLTKELEDLKAQNQTLTDKNAELDTLLKARKDEFGKKISELLNRIAEKDRELSAKNSEIADLKQQASEREQAIKKRDAAIDELRNQAKALEQEKEKAVADLKKTFDSLVKEMNDEIKKGEVTITQLRGKLSVNMVEKILFDSGSAEIKEDGKKILDRVAGILKKVTDKQIRVEGHTDNVPIGPRIIAKFPTNWELSAARATTVTRYLQDQGIDPTMLSACAFSKYRPVESNDTEEGKSKNRRIEISLIPKE